MYTCFRTNVTSIKLDCHNHTEATVSYNSNFDGNVEICDIFKNKVKNCNFGMALTYLLIKETIVFEQIPEKVHVRTSQRRINQEILFADMI